MALGTPQGVTFSKAARYTVLRQQWQRRSKRSEEEEDGEEEKKLEALSKKQSERKRNWKLSHATAWRWQATMIYGILETETELRRKRNTVKSRVCNHKITWLIYNGILFKYQHIRNQVPSYRVVTVVSLRFKSQLIAVKQTCNWLSRRMTLEERMVNAWR